MLKAIIFDFDGIIVDTEPLHYRAFQKILVPLGLGYSWNDYVDCYMGFDDREAFLEAFKVNGRDLSATELGELIDRKASIFEEIISDGIKAYPGAVELIRDLSGELPLALCSGALSSDIAPILNQLEINNAFDVIVTAEDVAASKPDPESYVQAVNRLNAIFPEKLIMPWECLAIEDTPAGITSAQTAGIPVLAVTNSYPIEKLDGAVCVIKSLGEVTLGSLRQISSEASTNRL
jgi:beta-phosphoglucomutase